MILSREYFINLFSSSNLNIIGCIFIIVLLICILSLKNNNKNLQDRVNKLKVDNLNKYNKLSMIEYQVRKYKEGGNAHTVLRAVGDILSNAKGGNYSEKK